MAKRGRPPKEVKETVGESSDLETESNEDKEEGNCDETNNVEEPFNLETELQKENKYLRKGFIVFIDKNGYDVNTKENYDLYMKKYKEE